MNLGYMDAVGDPVKVFRKMRDKRLVNEDGSTFNTMRKLKLQYRMRVGAAAGCLSGRGSCTERTLYGADREKRGSGMEGDPVRMGPSEDWKRGLEARIGSENSEQCKRG
jgi:hypothetical protein